MDSLLIEPLRVVSILTEFCSVTWLHPWLIGGDGGGKWEQEEAPTERSVVRALQLGNEGIVT